MRSERLRYASFTYNERLYLPQVGSDQGRPRKLLTENSEQKGLGQKFIIFKVSNMTIFFICLKRKHVLDIPAINILIWCSHVILCSK